MKLTTAIEMAFQLVVVVILVVLQHDVSGYCFGAGKNPGFSGSPRVQQINLEVVRISWKDLVTQRECADYFYIKYWPKSDPNNYKMSEKIDQDKDYGDVKVTAKIPYQFQALAVENKGLLLGIDFNRAPVIEFMTSSTGNQLVVPKEELEYHRGQEEDIYLNPESEHPILGNSKYADDISNLLPKQEKRPSVAGMSIELFVVLVSLAVIVVCLISGLCYKMVKAKKAMDVYDDDEEEERGEHGDKEEKVSLKSAPSRISIEPSEDTQTNLK